MHLVASTSLPVFTFGFRYIFVNKCLQVDICMCIRNLKRRFLASRRLRKKCWRSIWDNVCFYNVQPVRMLSRTEQIQGPLMFVPPWCLLDLTTLDEKKSFSTHYCYAVRYFSRHLSLEWLSRHSCRGARWGNAWQPSIFLTLWRRPHKECAWSTRVITSLFKDDFILRLSDLASTWLR